MSESSSEDRTEEPTSRRLLDARKEGQIARSMELPAAAVTISAMGLIFFMGGYLVNKLSERFAAGFHFDRKLVFSSNLLPALFADELLQSFVLIIPIFILTVVVAIVSTGLTGGYNFSMQAVMPKASKLNPFSGLQRIFGPKAWVELGKAILKFVLVTGVVIAILNNNIHTLNLIGRMPIEPALQASGELLTKSALLITLSLLIIAMIDVPYQRWQFMKQMRMTKQQVKDEMRQSEGNPEIKGQIRRKQREMSNARMIDSVKNADVVITNPEHFAVALSYDPNGDSAPILLAKGTDEVAARIREEAQKHGIEIFQAAPLARALYFTTEIEHPVPEDLYYAVAQVIAYVFNLASITPGAPPVQKPDPKVPEAMQFDSMGRLQTQEAVV
ncbi:MAG: flagellar biosynthesis protein FlhB [Burkholderiales bacterium]|nr:flagellar biosynthesis protein FlhB [Burkholderiales bacterium]